MTRSSFAPELSATFTRVSCWTIRLLGLLHDLEHPPALLLGEGARLGDADEVAHAALVLLVVDLEDLARVLQLADRMLEPELVQLPARRAQAHAQLVRLEDPELVDLHLWPPASAALITRVFIGSLAAASFIASLATCGVTPPISNSTRPGLTTATQPSGLPLPEPMRVSAGFLVIDLSGKTRIQIWPPRLTWRVMARRAASICRFDIHAASIACRPKSPNATVAPCVAMPWRRPRCILRYLTRLGISISYPPSSCSSLRPPS